MFEISQNHDHLRAEEGAKIKVIGVGGGGCNAVNTMIKAGLGGVEYVVANTDAQALNANHAPTKIQLGIEVTKGLGAGANPEIGRKAALDEYEKLSEVIEGADMVFVTAGMGGGTGTGAAPVIAKLARELGALTVGVVTKPFLFEGKKRSRQAQQGIVALEDVVDSLITIPNQRLLYLAGENLSLVDTFKKADEVLLNAVRGISDLINNTGHINADFADVSTVMANKGLSLMGTGRASGTDRAIKAATEAISSPLLEDISIDGATGIIINITGNETLTMHETNEAVTLIMEAADEEAEIIFGTVIDDSLEEEIKVTVVATGLGGAERVTTSSLKKMKNTVSIPQENIQQRIEEVVPKKMSFTEDRYQRSGLPSQDDEIEFSPRQEDSEKEHSSLVESIKDAASRYEMDMDKEKTLQTQSNSYPQEDRIVEQKRQRAVHEETKREANNRAKSIAERLGFITFDEEELDKPTFMRKDDNDRENSSEVRNFDI
jgi:cell division protein FtsZ